MENTNVSIPEKQENLVAGIVGAFLFSLVGGVLWYVLYQVGFLAGISGIAGVICAIKGYEIFGKKQSKKGVVISVIIAALVMVIAWYVCLANDVYLAYQDWYAAGEVDFTLTFFESVQSAWIFLTEPDVAGAYLLDLGIGLLLCGVGAWTTVKQAFNKAKQSEAPVQPVYMEMPQDADSEAVVVEAPASEEPVAEDTAAEEVKDEATVEE